MTMWPLLSIPFFILFTIQIIRYYFFAPILRGGLKGKPVPPLYQFLFHSMITPRRYTIAVCLILLLFLTHSPQPADYTVHFPQMPRYSTDPAKPNYISMNELAEKLNLYQSIETTTTTTTTTYGKHRGSPNEAFVIDIDYQSNMAQFFNEWDTPQAYINHCGSNKNDMFLAFRSMLTDSILSNRHHPSSFIKRVALDIWLRYHFGRGWVSFFNSLPYTIEGMIRYNQHQQQNESKLSSTTNRVKGRETIATYDGASPPRVTRLTNFDLVLLTLVNDMRLLAVLGYDGSIHAEDCPALRQSHKEYFGNDDNGFYHFTGGNLLSLPMHTHNDKYASDKVSFAIVTYGSKIWAIAPDYTNFCPKGVPGTSFIEESDFVAFNYNPFFPAICRQQQYQQQVRQEEEEEGIKYVYDNVEEMPPSSATTKRLTLGSSHMLQPMQLMFVPVHHAHAIYTPDGGGIGALFRIPTKTFESSILSGLYKY